MTEYEDMRNAIEKESMAIQERLTDRPQIFSEQGLAYWKGNVEALKWALTIMANIHSSTSTAKREQE